MIFRKTGNFFRRTGCHDFPTCRSPFGAEVDDPVGRFDHFEVVFDHEYGVALLDEKVEYSQ